MSHYAPSSPTALRVLPSVRVTGVEWLHESGLDAADSPSEDGKGELYVWIDPVGERGCGVPRLRLSPEFGVPSDPCVPRAISNPPMSALSASEIVANASSAFSTFGARGGGVRGPIARSVTPAALSSGCGEGSACRARLQARLHAPWMRFRIHEVERRRRRSSRSSRVRQDSRPDSGPKRRVGRNRPRLLVTTSIAGVADQSGIIEDHHVSPDTAIRGTKQGPATVTGSVQLGLERCG